MDKFARQMMHYRDVLECHHVTGDESFMLKVKSANTGSLEKLLGEIRSVEGVTRTVTKWFCRRRKRGKRWKSMRDWLKLPTLERSDDERKELRAGRGLVRYMKKGGSRSASQS